MRGMTLIAFPLLYRTMNGNITSPCRQLPMAPEAESRGFLAEKNPANNAMGKMACLAGIVSHRLVHRTLLKVGCYLRMTILAAFACGLG